MTTPILALDLATGSLWGFPTVKTGACQQLSKRQRSETPAAFRDLLLSIARQVVLRATP